MVDTVGSTGITPHTQPTDGALSVAVVATGCVRRVGGARLADTGNHVCCVHIDASTIGLLDSAEFLTGGGSNGADAVLHVGAARPFATSRKT